MYRLHFTCYYNYQPCSINTTSYIACAIDVYHWLLLFCPYCHGTTSKHQWYYKISSFVNKSSLDMHTLFYIFLGRTKKGMIRVPNSLKSWMSFSCMIFHQTPALFCIMDQWLHQDKQLIYIRCRERTANHTMWSIVCMMWPDIIMCRHRYVYHVKP